MEELALGTDITLYDTDNDGLSDYQETFTNTNPLIADTNGNGIIDGDDQNDTTIRHGSGVIVTLNSKGSELFNSFITLAPADHPARNGLPLGDVWTIEHITRDITQDAAGNFIANGFDKAALTLPLPESITSRDELTLAVWNTVYQQWEPHKSQTIIDLENHTITSDVPHFSTWAVIKSGDWIDDITSELISGRTDEKIINILTRVERWPDYLLEQDELNRSIPYLPEFTVHDIRDARSLVTLYDNALRPLADFPGTNIGAAKERLRLIEQLLVEPFALANFAHTHPTNLTTTLQFVNDYELIEGVYETLDDEELRQEALLISELELTEQIALTFEAYERTAYALNALAHYYDFVGSVDSSSTVPFPSTIILDVNQQAVLLAEAINKSLEFIEEYSVTQLFSSDYPLQCLASEPNTFLKVSSASTTTLTPSQNIGVNILNTIPNGSRRIPVVFFATSLWEGYGLFLDSVIEKSKEIGEELRRAHLASLPPDAFLAEHNVDDLEDLLAIIGAEDCDDPCRDDPESDECKCEEIRTQSWLSQERLTHIIDRHWYDSLEPMAGKFSPEITIPILRMLINEAILNGEASPNGDRPGWWFNYTFTNLIGIDRSGKETSNLRVVVRPTGQIITAFPDYP
ncbi:hypothetical protein NBRC116591_22450 [Sessilibacter corallicola]|uniref:Uncharacterized protein n=1 Tax=Sessilibacter corallicola TaxID=2904075 RepID=A0ABQ0A9V1_9GAMM